MSRKSRNSHISRAIWLMNFTLAIAVASYVVVLAPDFFETGGYIHRAFIHGGICFASIVGFISIRNLIKE